ncbi:sensor histidine kinase [Mucilaginibacter xinganensis]|nr:HAMP domain-containing sensor histidine kinase [Mucilaginibacter xinganensis]
MGKNLEVQGLAAKTLRKLFIIFLLFTFIITVGSFVLKHTITQKLDKLGAQLKEPSREPEISNILLDLSSAENDFQAGLQGHPEKLEEYKSKLKNIFVRIEAVQKKFNADSAQYLKGSKQQIARSFEQKLKISQQVFELKHHFDSLLNVTTIASLSKPVNGLGVGGFLKAKASGNKADTTVKISNVVNKSGLLRRLKDAISNKNQVVVKTLTIRKEKQIRDSVAGFNGKKDGRSLAKLLQQLNRQNSYMLMSGEQLIGANLNLLAELQQLLQQLKNINQAAWEKGRDNILQQYKSTTDDMNSFIGVAISLILIFIILLIIYINKAGEAEQGYITENERAVALAGQKSEILAIMSHEIRNKLMAINGAVYMLNKTPLTADQEKKTASINLSSSMLLETVNNVLDVSKLEQQQTEVLVKTDFEPFKELTDAVETMRFMAEKKHIYLTTEFTGDLKTKVNGDSLRLKQVLINLLSNAIKYTDNGGVKVIATIDRSNNQKVLLKIAIADTGYGIPKDQQAQLFTRYYQTKGINRKPGTGLGLYLCRQLIQLHGGSISVESEAGKGCTMSLVIPY